MLQLRPTFSESWYRVAGLKAKLRPNAQISRQYYRGDRWYVVRDPASNQFHRLSDAAYRFVGLLDGKRTVAEAWELVGGQLDDDAPTQPEVIQILSQLYAANLLEANISPDATVLLRRHKLRQKREMQGRLMSILFPRIPLWDPDRFLKMWMPLMRVFLSKFGVVLWLAVVLGGVFTVVGNWSELRSSANSAIDPGNWIFLYVTFVLIKFIHELGHAFACRRFGGECHEMGIMFLVFIPTPYVDASSAWAFPSKWQRIFVGAGGMIFEIFIAAIAAFVWANANPNWIFPVKQLAYNTMLIASVTTILFNANPLLRYDGYYMLSDWLEIPNLQHRSTEYVLGLVKRHVFRVKQQQPLPPIRQRIWLFFYGICSSIYRVMIGFAIILFVAFKVPILGVLMAIGGVVQWLCMPVYKLFKYLTLDPELHRKRGRATAFVLAAAVIIIITIGVIPFPVRFQAVGVVEPVGKEVVYSHTPGRIIDVRVRDGDTVRKGDVLLVCRNEELETELETVKLRLKGLNASYWKNVVFDQAMAQIDMKNIELHEQRLADLQRRMDALTVRAPIDGEVIAPGIDQVVGQWLPDGREVATVATIDTLETRAVIEQREYELVNRSETFQSEIRLAGDVGTVLQPADRPKVIHAAQSNLPHPSLGYQGGGSIAINPEDRQGIRPVVQQFEVRVKIDNTEGRYYPGQRAYVRITTDSESLMWQWSRRFWQLIQTKNFEVVAAPTR